jgi:hypothetical protein
LSRISITSKHITNLSEVDVDDVEDIQIPQTFLGLPTWWMDLELPLSILPSTPADINAALSEYTAKDTKV